jgi:tRNA A-37 threonylcarbamoyl transferase component Bud32
MPELPAAGDDFAGYKILGVLGRGRTSVVYQAGNPRLGNVIALKVLIPELAADDVFRIRFFEESRIAAALNHPNVIPIHDMGSAGGLLYIAMRQVAGTDLRRLLSQAGEPQQGGPRPGGRLPAARAVALLTQAARALDAAHRKGLVHRDVKPGNLLVERGDGERGDGGDGPGHVYLTDFGITKVMSSRTGLTSPGEFVGTVDYIAPEQIRGISVMGMADQYSLGCVLYECLTGRVPFRKDADAAVIFAHVEEQPPPPSTVRPDLPKSVDTVIARALAKQPGDRYASCRAFMEAAAGALDASPSASAEIAHGGDTGAVRGDFTGIRGELEAARSVRDDRDRKARRRWPVAAAALFLVVAGAATWFGVRGGAPVAQAGAAAMSMSSPKPTPARTRSPLMAAVVQANTITGKVPPSRCVQQGPSRVTCASPAPGVTGAGFLTYPSLAALYAAYKTAMKSVDGGRVVQDSQDCGLTAPPATGAETGWNHQFKHPKNYTIAQMASGRVPVTAAAGRVFCVTNPSSGVAEYIWTQNDGRMLGWVTGPLHEQVWNWWLAVHHEIAIGKPPMMMPSMRGAMGGLCRRRYAGVMSGGLHALPATIRRNAFPRFPRDGRLPCRSRPSALASAKSRFSTAMARHPCRCAVRISVLTAARSRPSRRVAGSPASSRGTVTGGRPGCRPG